MIKCFYCILLVYVMASKHIGTNRFGEKWLPRPIQVAWLSQALVLIVSVWLNRNSFRELLRVECSIRCWNQIEIEIHECWKIIKKSCNKILVFGHVFVSNHVTNNITWLDWYMLCVLNIWVWWFWYCRRRFRVIIPPRYNTKYPSTTLRWYGYIYQGSLNIYITPINLYQIILT